MITYLSAVASLLSFRFRSRASLEVELLTLRHQVTVLRRQRPGRLRLFCADRLLWVWLYRIWPQALNAMVLVKPFCWYSAGLVGTNWYALVVVGRRWYLPKLINGFGCVQYQASRSCRLWEDGFHRSPCTQLGRRPLEPPRYRLGKPRRGASADRTDKVPSRRLRLWRGALSD
jgi:hypothetical protein